MISFVARFPFCDSAFLLKLLPVFLVCSVTCFWGFVLALFNSGFFMFGERGRKVKAYRTRIYIQTLGRYRRSHCSELNGFSSATKTLSDKVGLITKEVVEVCHCQVTEKKFLEPWNLEAKIPSWQNVCETDLKTCFSLFGLKWMILT